MNPKLISLFIALALGVAPAAARDIVALCIGNDAYVRDEDKLDTPVADARLMKQALEALPGGADVKLLTDASRADIVIALNALKERARGAKLALVFYSGHGMDGQPTGYATEDTFLLPVEAVIPSEDHLAVSAVGLREVLAALKECPVTARAVILDCCRTGAPKAVGALVAGGTKNFGQLDERVKVALGKAVVPDATLVAFAASPGRKAAAFLNTSDKNSPFTAFLAAQLGSGAGNLRDLVEAAAEQTERATERRQVPYVTYSGATSAIRQIVFRETAVAPVAVTPPGMSEAEVAALKAQLAAEKKAREEAERRAAQMKPTDRPDPSVKPDAPPAPVTMARTEPPRIIPPPEDSFHNVPPQWAAGSVPLEEKLIGAWEAVREKRTLAEMDAAQAVFASVAKHLDPEVSYQSEAGLAALEAWRAGGSFLQGPREVVQLWPFCRTPLVDKLGNDENDSPDGWGYLDRTGTEVIPPQWDNARYFHEGMAAVKRAGKWGFIDRTGKEAITPEWDWVTDFRRGLAHVSRDDKQSFIDPTGMETLPPLDYLGGFSEGLVVFKRDGKYGYADQQGNEVIRPQWSWVNEFSEGLAAVRLDQNYGYIDRTGKEVSAPQWEYAWEFSEGLALVKSGKKEGYIDRSGKEVIPPQWEDARPFSEGLAAVERGGKWGVIDRTGREVVSPRWDRAESRFSEGLLAVARGDKWGYVDRSGREVIAPVWDYAGDFSEGLTGVMRAGKWGVIDRSGREIIKPQWIDQSINFLNTGLGSVFELFGERPTEEGKTIPARMYYLDKSGRIIWSSDGKGVGGYGPLGGEDPVVKERLVGAWEAVREKRTLAGMNAAEAVFEVAAHVYDPVLSYQGEAGLAAIESWKAGGGHLQGSKEIVELWPFCRKPAVGKYGTVEELTGAWGYIDRSGKEVIAPQWDVASAFDDEGMAKVKRDGKWGFIDRSGNEVIAPQWDEVNSFSEGLAQVVRSGKWGFIDRSGKEVIPPQWDGAAYFSEGMAMVRRARKCGFIDRDGKEIVAIQWDDADPFSEGLARVERAGKFGFIDQSGAEVIAPQWDDAWDFNEGLAAVELDGEWGFIDRTGKLAIEPKWDDVGWFSEGLADFEDEDGHGYINRSGEEVINLYDEAESFEGGMGMVKFGDKWGFIDRTDQEVIAIDFDLVRDFFDGLAEVERSGKWGFIDTSGKEVSAPIWDFSRPFQNGLAMVIEVLGPISVAGGETAPARMCYLDRDGKIIWSSDGMGFGGARR